MRSGMKFIAALGSLILATSLSGRVSAAAILSEDFNSPAFIGTPGLLGSNSDRYTVADYYKIDNADGWSFVGDTQDSVGHIPGGGKDGALLLNEGIKSTSATHALTGLTPGQNYILSFDYWGDNIPGGPWGLMFSVGDSKGSLTGVDVAAGTNPGSQEDFSFTARAPSETLTFTETTPPGSLASPIIDNVAVAPGGSGAGPPPPEPATWAMMILGFGMVGLALRRRGARPTTREA